MASLNHNPVTIRLARDLGLSVRGDCLDAITKHALSQVSQTIEQSPCSVADLEMLKALVADSLSVTLEYIDSDENLDEIAREYEPCIPHLAGQLRADFVDGNSEGLLLVLARRESWQRKYLAVIDRRGEQSNRANFTTWHELAHLLTAPPQYVLNGMRRSPTQGEIAKDPIEQITDHVAGL